MLYELLNVAVCGHESMGPEGKAALVQTFLNLIRRRLEYGGRGEDHLKLTIHASEPGKRPLTDFAYELH